MSNDAPSTARTSPWLSYCKPQAEDGLRLFCFPYAGGGASVYRGWGEALGAEVTVCPVQYPGRETRMRERPYKDVELIVEDAAKGLMPYLDKPFAFFGHSMGALVAFELARYLVREKGVAPKHVFVSAYRAPQLEYQTSLPYDLPDDEFMQALRELEGTPREALENPELMAYILPILRADCQVCDMYEHTDDTPLPCPLTAFGGTQDAEAQQEALPQWGELTTAKFDMEIFPGGHFFLQTARADLLGCIRARLQAALR